MAFSAAKVSAPLATPRQKLETAELLFRSAQRMNLRPSWITPNGVFAISVDGQEQYVNLANSELNSHASSSLAKDKYLTRLILDRYEMPNIPFARVETQKEAAAFLNIHGTIIAKPVSGAGAHDIHIITLESELQALPIFDYILEKYVAGEELRFLVLNGEVIGVHRSDYGTSVEYTRYLERISYVHDDWDQALVTQSIQIAGILGLNFAAVDYLIDASGRAYILEVNTSPGLKWFHAPTSGPIIDVASLFLSAMLALKDNRKHIPGQSAAHYHARISQRGTAFNHKLQGAIA